MIQIAALTSEQEIGACVKSGSSGPLNGFTAEYPAENEDLIIALTKLRATVSGATDPPLSEKYRPPPLASTDSTDCSTVGSHRSRIKQSDSGYRLTDQLCLGVKLSL